MSHDADRMNRQLDRIANTLERALELLEIFAAPPVIVTHDPQRSVMPCNPQPMQTFPPYPMRPRDPRPSTITM